MFKRQLLARAISASLLGATLAIAPLPGTDSVRSAHAQQGATVQGRVTDAGTGAALAGVRVRVAGSTQLAVTDATGVYRLRGVDAGAIELVFDYLGFENVVRQVEAGAGTRSLDVALSPLGADGEVLDLGTIEVRSQFESQSRSLNQQRASDALINVIAADSIGQYPDQNVAESLQRLPGVSITRDQGEGRFVVIRGLDANLNTVSVNGMTIGTPEDEVRSATLDVIPSDSTERLTVIKVPTPDMPGDAIGGAIEIESASGFDREGRSIRARLEGSYPELSGDVNHKLSFNYSEVFDDVFGVAFGLSHLERDFESDNVEVEYDINDELGRDLLVPVELQYRKYFINRERTGLNLNLDYRPDDANSFYLRTLYSEFTDAETRQRSIFGFGDGTLASEAGRQLVFEDVPADALSRRIRYRTKEQDTLAVSAGARHEFEAWGLDYRVGYSDTRERVPDEVEARFEYDGDDLVANVDTRRPVPTFALIDPAGPDAYLRNANYEVDRFITARNVIDDNETSLALNVDFDAAGARWKAGLLGRFRQRDVDLDERELRAVPDLNLGEWTSASPGFRQGAIGDGISTAALLAYLRANAGALAERPRDVAENNMLSAVGDYQADEDITAAYLMATYDIDALRIIAGARVERTEWNALGTIVETDADGDIVEPFGTNRRDNSYTSVLPGLHLRYDTEGGWVLRGAVTKSIARPGFGDLSPRLMINLEDAEIEAGNPDLEPYESTNIDLSAEYYFGESGIVSIGLFDKSIDGYIVQRTINDDPAFPGFDVTRAVNGDSASVQGIELNWQQRLTMLPEGWDGLLVGLGVTLLDTEFGIDSRPGEDFSLPRASDEIYSAYLGYEKGPLSTRLSYARRGEYLEEIGDDTNFDLYVASNSQLDFTLNYEIDKRWTVYLEAANLLDEPLELYQGTPANTLQLEEYGITYALGIKVKL